MTIGSLGGGLAIGSGLYSTLNAGSYDDPVAGTTVAVTGVMEATSGLTYGSGAILGAEGAMKIGAFGMRAFGGAGLFAASLAQLPSDIERGDTAMIISNTAGMIGGLLMIAAAFGPVGWGLIGTAGLVFGAIALGGQLGRLAGWW